MSNEGQISSGNQPRVSPPRDYVRNFNWLVLGRLLRVGLSLTVGGLVARYLAPAEFGKLSYLLAVVGFFAALAGAGLDGLVVRDLFNQRCDRGELLCTAWTLKAGLGVVLYLGLVLSWRCLMGGGTGFWVVTILGADLLLQSGNVFDQYFQACLANKWSVVAGTVSIVVASLVRVGLILAGASLEWFAAAIPLESAVLAGFLACFYFRRRPTAERWRFSARCARQLLTESWPMVISAVAIAGCMRVDQIMLKSLAGEAAVGAYAAAARLGEAWYFLPMLMTTALNPWILEGRALGGPEHRRRLVRFYAYVFWSALAVAGGMCVVASPLVRILFGVAYADAAAPLRLHVAGGVFLALGMASGKWYLAEGHTLGLMRKALFGLGVGLVGNVLLIPRYGVCGAAAATATGHFAANVLYDLLDARVRPQFALKLRALAPWSLGQT